jgi:hypothetical protein
MNDLNLNHINLEANVKMAYSTPAGDSDCTLWSLLMRESKVCWLSNVQVEQLNVLFLPSELASSYSNEQIGII